MDPGNEFDLNQRVVGGGNSPVKQKKKEKVEIVVMAMAIIITLICLVRVTVASIAYAKQSRLVAVRGQHFYLFSH